MTAEHASWVLPLVKEGYKHREDIVKGVGWLKNWLTRTQRHIVITGMEGVGKSVLFKFMSGEGFTGGFKKPVQSQKPESGRLLFQEGKSAVSVFPGQKDVGDIIKKNNELIEKFGVPEGVIHVVSNGLASIRNPVNLKNEMERHPTIESYQTATRDLEVDDLGKVLGMLEGFHHTDNKPTWMVVAVTKCDLYGDTLGSVREMYDPAGSGKFVEKLKTFITDVTGPTKFRWSAIPVCCTLDPFVWGQEKLLSQANEPQRDKLVDDFLEHLGSY